MKYKYISAIPKPLLKDFINNRVIPLVGAGFSKNADIPKGLLMPDWNELGKIVATEIADYEYSNDAIDALSYYEELYSRPKLVELLLRELHFGKIQPGATYKAFCELFTGTICTTNFDSLLEDAMTLLHRPVSVIVTKDRLTVGSKGESKIIKLHGDFNHPEKMVITERDYDIYLEKNPIFATYVANLFITNTMLLIGYSLDDNDFRSVWQIINSRLGSMSQPAYCITVNASCEKVAKYQRRNIRIINLEGKSEDYKTILHDFFIELKNYIDNERDRVAKSSDEKINEQMIIPAEDNKLCFISCAMSRISQLTALLSPVFQNLGITSVRIDDMLMPDDNWIDVSSTAIRKSKAAIVDVSDSSSNVMLELGLIKSSKSQNNVLIICEKGTVLPVSLSDNRVLTYTFDVPYEDDYHFIMLFEEWCRSVFEIETAVNDITNKHNLFADAHRLLDKGEYSGCIVSAYSELEHRLSLQPTNQCTERNNGTHKAFMINQSLKNIVDHQKVKEILTLRNKVVHQNYSATEEEASAFLHITKEIYDSLCR